MTNLLKTLLWASFALFLTACEAGKFAQDSALLAAEAQDVELNWPHQAVPAALAKAVPNLLQELDDKTSLRVTDSYISALGQHCKQYQIIKKMDDDDGAADALSDYLACKGERDWRPVHLYTQKA